MLKDSTKFDDLKPIDEELEKNSLIKSMYSPEDIINGTEVKISWVKVWIRKFKIVVFDWAISNKDWENLLFYLKLENNKIIGLDFRNAGIDRYFGQFLTYMKSDNYHWYFKYLKFGVCTLDSMQLIKLANFLLTFYSDTERSFPKNFFQYCCQMDDANYKNNRLDLTKKAIKTFDMSIGTKFGKSSPSKNFSKYDLDVNTNKSATKRFSDFQRKQIFIKKHDAADDILGNSSVDPNSQEKDIEQMLTLTMILDRNLSIFDYKVIFAIHKLWMVDLHIEISEIKYKYPKPFNPEGWPLISEIKSVVRAMDYYESDKKFQKQISYRTIVWIWYINFFFYLVVAIIVPITNKDSWGNGLYWRAHYIMAGFLFINFVLEVSMFFICMPFRILKDIIASARGDQRKNASKCFTTLLAIGINSWFLFSGIISKIDMYNDVSFALEVRDWGYPMLAIFYMITFCTSIVYQIYSYVKLLFNISHSNCVYPVSEQTARLLLWWDFKCMALIIEKFSLTYYTNFFGKKMHTPMMLAFINWFFENLPQVTILIIYLFLENGTSSFIVYMSMWSSIASWTISFIAFTLATSSILSNRDLEELRKSGVIKNMESKYKQIADLHSKSKFDVSLILCAFLLRYFKLAKKESVNIKIHACAKLITKSRVRKKNGPTQNRLRGVFKR